MNFHNLSLFFFIVWAYLFVRMNLKAAGRKRWSETLLVGKSDDLLV
jgi:hypothetical protein